MWKCFGCQSTRLGRPRATEEAKRGPKNDYFRLLAVSGPEDSQLKEGGCAEKVFHFVQMTMNTSST